MSPKKSAKDQAVDASAAVEELTTSKIVDDTDVVAEVDEIDEDKHADDSDDSSDSADSASEDSEKAPKRSKKQNSEQELEQEGEIAADFIEEFLDAADLDGDLDIEFRGERVYISVTSEGESNLKRISSPETVESLQELTRLAVQSKTGTMSRLILDVAGSRDARVAELKSMVERVLDKLEDSDKEQHLKPMSSYERKLVHDMVSEAGFISESEGQGKDRHIVVRKA